MHRLATLRDDIVFFIFLYQRWIYPIDKTRPNEYGVAYEEKKKDEQNVQAKKSESKKKR